MAIVFWAGLIFYFSSRPTGQSEGQSLYVSIILQQMLAYGFPQVMHIDLDIFDGVIRKMAHFFLYFCLGLLTIKAWCWRKDRSWVYALFFCFCYAVTDEFHQSFVPGRSAEIHDVLLDTIGSFTGIMVIFFLRKIWRRVCGSKLGRFI